MRSLLFVPGDRPDRFEKAAASGADALILDLEDSVLPERKAQARQAVAEFLARPRGAKLFVRLNPQGAYDADLVAVLPHRPDGLVLPKAEGAAGVRALVNRLEAVAIPILPIATETPRAVFGLSSYGEVAAHLCGLTWGAEDLSSAIGAAPRDEGGALTGPYETVRTLALFAAHAAGVAAIETVYPNIADADGLAAYAARARRDGFSGMMAIHPAQVAAINAAFTPTQAERDWAGRVIQAFADNPGAGAIRLDGRMLDLPHLKAARRILG